MKLIKEECEKALNTIGNVTLYHEKDTGFSETIISDYPNEFELLLDLTNEYFKLEQLHMKLLSQWGKSDNPPLKFEELKDGMWVWDKDFDRFGAWLKILIVKINDYDEKIIKAHCIGTNEIMIRSYKKDRFYRKEVAQ